MKSTAVFTIVSNNYLPYARTLMESLSVSNPELAKFVCIVDEPWGAMRPFPADVSVKYVSTLDIPSLTDMATRYNVMEFNTAVKPFMFGFLLKEMGFERAIYLDPDIFVFEALDEVRSLLDRGASAVLTPHLLAPLEDGRKPDDHAILQSGVFNLGFAAMTNADEALDFIAWWGRRLRFQGASDIRNNLFTDQRWCDFAPCFMANLAILRHQGYNVAYWNLAQRNIQKTAAGQTLVEGGPLVFFHFSGLSFDEPKLVSKHQTRFKWADLGAAQELFTDYRRALTANGWEEAGDVPYAYSRIEGLMLAQPIRSLYNSSFPREVPREPLSREFIIRLCNELDKPRAGSAGAAITHLMRHVHDVRRDLQETFDLASADGRKAYARWFEASAGREYGLDDCLAVQALIRGKRVKPVRDAIRSDIANADRSLSYRLWRKCRKKLMSWARVLGR